MPQQHMIALVFDYNLSYPRGVLRGVRQYAANRPDWTLVLHGSDGFTPRSMASLQGVGLISDITSVELAKTLQTLPQPVVNVTSVVPNLNFPCVSVDHNQVGRLAFQHLWDRGFRQFAFVGHPHHPYSYERENGFREALTEVGLTPECYYDRSRYAYRHRGRMLTVNSELQQWLRNLKKPVGVFACHDVWAVHVIGACRLTELRVPEDVAVIGVDNDDLLCELALPSLSSIHVPVEQIGYQAAALLDRLLKGEKRPEQPHLIPPVGVVARQSTDILAGADPDVTEALLFIRRNAHRPISVGELLRQVPVSRRSLEMRFRSLLERGIGEEIRRVHLERAKELLATSVLSVEEVAERSGFASAPYFARFFRQATRMTPSDYRRQFHGSLQH
ncbi:substrate-binding domain-containing protein [Thalassoglobus sp. JC818]|uniref:AraC family transcriptional regulator n=1 Tax=Thalassoglobus sp. JC818 TaxID=3232136 RepID=UPI00345A1391